MTKTTPAHKMRNTFSLVLMAFLIVGGLLLFSHPQPTSAETFARPSLLCSGNSCIGYYPPYWGCDADPITVSSRFISLPANIGYHELRYSVACKSFWSRAVVTTNGYYIGATLDRQDKSPDFYLASSAPLNAYQTIYTTMGSSLGFSLTCGSASANTQVNDPVYIHCGIDMRYGS